MGAEKERGAEPDLYEMQDASVAQRFVLAGLAAAWMGLAWWMLFGGGLRIAGSWFGWSWQAGDGVRRGYLATALTVYYVRLLGTWFVFLRRGVRWKEVFAVATWLLCIDLLLAVAGGRNAGRFGAERWVSAAVFAAGSWMNTWAEYQRYVWKREGHAGKLYTQGLFRYTRHPNYLGDVVSYLGLCLMAGRWVTAVLPVITCAGFVFVNIPALDGHLRRKYGRAFEEYAARTARLVPFLY